MADILKLYPENAYSTSVSLRCSLELHIAKKLPVDDDDADPQTTLGVARTE